MVVAPQVAVGDGAFRFWKALDEGYAEFAPYCCNKSAVISLTQAGVREFAKNKITVNAFAPGVVVTPLWDGLEQDMT